MGKSRTRRAPGSVAGFAAAAGIALVTGACSNTQNLSVSPAAYVERSAQTTLAQKTADITISGSMQAAGQTIPMNGTGETNFTAGTVLMNFSITASGASIQLKELVAGGNVYLGGNFAGETIQQLTGKTWAELPFNLSSSEVGSGDPVAELRLAASKGGTVTPLGTQTIDGRSVTGYSVVPSKAAMIAEAQKVLAQSGFSASEQAAANQAVQQMTPPTIELWFDSSDLIRRESLSLQTGGSLAMTGNLLIDFTHYGVPVQIGTPAASDVVSYQQFLQDAQNQGS